MVKHLIVLLSGLLLLASCSLLPLSALPTPNVQDAVETSIPSALPTVVTFTATPSPLPIFTWTPEPSWTPTVTIEPTPAPTFVPTDDVSQQGVGVLRFQVQEGSPKYMQNFLYPEQGCDWVGVVGQVFDEDGQALQDQVVLISGVVDGVYFEKLGMSGLNTANSLGGYEIQLADHLPATTTLLQVQLFDLDGISLSVPFQFDIPTFCEQNLVIINFVSVLSKPIL